MKIKPVLAQKPHQIKGFKPPERPQNPEELIEKLLQCCQLRGWERSYVLAAKATKRRSKRQIEKVEAIAAHLSQSLLKEGGVA